MLVAVTPGTLLLLLLPLLLLEEPQPPTATETRAAATTVARGRTLRNRIRTLPPDLDTSILRRFKY